MAIQTINPWRRSSLSQRVFTAPTALFWFFIIINFLYSSQTLTAYAGGVESINNSESSGEASVCFVVRTYWGHGDEHGGELRAFLRSLQAQDNPKYVSLVRYVQYIMYEDVVHH